MKGPAAGAEDLPLNGHAAVAVTVVEEEVARRGRRSTAGCCRYSRCEVALAALLALAVVAAAASGYMLFTQVRNALTSGSGEGRVRKVD